MKFIDGRKEKSKLPAQRIVTFQKCLQSASQSTFCCIIDISSDVFVRKIVVVQFVGSWRLFAQRRPHIRQSWIRYLFRTSQLLMNTGQIEVLLEFLQKSQRNTWMRVPKRFQVDIFRNLRSVLIRHVDSGAGYMSTPSRRLAIASSSAHCSKATVNHSIWCRRGTPCSAGRDHCHSNGCLLCALPHCTPTPSIPRKYLRRNTTTNRCYVFASNHSIVRLDFVAKITRKFQ